MRTAWSRLPVSLRRQARITILLFGTGLILYAAGLIYGPFTGIGLRMGLATCSALPVLAYLVWHLSRNHAPDQTDVLYPGLGLGNATTLLRAFLLVLLVGLIPPEPGLIWLPWGFVSLWIGASLLDLADGFLARRTGQITVLGSQLDMEIDAFGVLVAASAGIVWGTLPPWFLPIVLLRPLWSIAIAWRTQQGRTHAPWPPSPRRRLAACLQYFVLGGALWPGIPALMVTAGAAFIAAVMIRSFGRDWLWTTGVWGRAPDRPGTWYAQSRTTLLTWLPLGLRPLAAMALLTMLADRPEPLTDPFSLALAILAGLTVPLLVVGTLVRPASLVLLICSGLLATRLAYVPSMSLAVLASMYLFLSDSGPLALSTRWDRYLAPDPDTPQPTPRAR